MNYHAYSYDIAHLEHDFRVRSGELRGAVHAGLGDRPPAAQALPSGSVPERPLPETEPLQQPDRSPIRTPRFSRARLT